MTVSHGEEHRLFSGISKADPSRPIAHFSHLHEGCCPFCHDPDFITLAKKKNIDKLVKRVFARSLDYKII